MARLTTLERISWLERARDASSAADMLAALVAAWRAIPSVALLALVDAVQLPKRPAPDHDEWIAAAEKRAPEDLDWLIEHLQTGRIATSRERAEALASWPPDPRMAPRLMQLMTRTQMRGLTTRPFWTVVFRIVHRQFHAGIAPWFIELDKLDGDFGDYIDAKLRSLRRRVESTTEAPIDAATQALIDAVAAKLDIAGKQAEGKSAEEFIRDIWAAPLDLGLREVFADWLQARGDPRGEFIMLQMTRKRRGLDAASEKREKALLKEHARTWMGPLEPAVDKKQFHFEGGFLFACKLYVRGMTAELMTHPAWSTVREYVLDGGAEGYCDRWLDHMIALGAKRK